MTYSIKNTGNEDITNLGIKVLVVDPDTGEIKHTFENTVNLNMAATISGQSVASTSNMPPKTYVTLLQASTSGTKQQKTLSSTTFVVKAPLVSIKGTIVANPNPVFRGRDEILSYSITNSGNEDIANLKVIVPVIDPDTQEVKDTLETVVNIQANATITGNFTFATTDITPKTYIADLRVSIWDMTEPKTLSSTTFEVKASLEITKTIPDKERVLVWLNYPWQSGQDCPDRALIEQALKDAGVSYHIVLDKKDFEAELRNLWYTDIMILGTYNPIEDHISEELREHVNSGTGLIASMFYRQNLDENVFGINYINSLSGRDYPIELAACQLWGAGEFQAYGRALDVEALSSPNVAAWIIEVNNKGTFRHPGIVTHTYGLGNVLYYAFDLGMSTSDYDTFASLLNTSLHYIHRSEQTDSFRPGQLVPVEITLKSLGGAFDIKITEQYPAEIRIYDPMSTRWITENPWIEYMHLESNETKTLLYYVSAPDQAGVYQFTTEVGYMENGTYTFYQKLDAAIAVDKSTAIITGDIIAALESLVVSGQEKAKIDEAIGYMRNVGNRFAAGGIDMEQNIHDILKATDALFSVTSVDTSSARVMIDGLLEIWEDRYYYKEKV